MVDMLIGAMPVLGPVPAFLHLAQGGGFGRLARFEITPQPVPPKRLLRIIQLAMRP